MLFLDNLITLLKQLCLFIKFLMNGNLMCWSQVLTFWWDFWFEQLLTSLRIKHFLNDSLCLIFSFSWSFLLITFLIQSFMSLSSWINSSTCGWDLRLKSTLLLCIKFSKLFLLHVPYFSFLVEWVKYVSMTSTGRFQYFGRLFVYLRLESVLWFFFTALLDEINVGFWLLGILRGSFFKVSLFQ